MDMRKIVLSLVASVAAVAFMAASTNAAEESQAVLKKQTKVTEAQARSTALARVVNGTVKSSELEKENGKLIWSFDIATPKTQISPKFRSMPKQVRSSQRTLKLRRSKPKRRSLKIKMDA